MGPGTMGGAGYYDVMTRCFNPGPPQINLVVRFAAQSDVASDDGRSDVSTGMPPQCV